MYPYLSFPPLTRTAYEIAWKAHTDQFRRDGVTPYITHIHKVMARVDDTNLVDMAVAILHDTHENDCANCLSVEALDTGLAAFGMEGVEVVDGVVTLSKKRGETYEAFIERIKEHRYGRWIDVKIADILANLSDEPSRKQLIKYSKALLVLLS